MGTYVTKKELKHILALFLAMLLFKSANDLGYKFFLVADTKIYRDAFNVIKYTNGFVWCVVLFLFIQHTGRKVSTFMLYLIFLVQIIPITTVYAFGDCNVIFYNELCVGFLICEILVLLCNNQIQVSEDRIPYYRIHIYHRKFYSRMLVYVTIISTFILLIYLLKRNGLPTLTALNIYKVYELRKSDIFQIGKYWNYLMTWLILGIIPFLIAKMIVEKRYLIGGVLILAVFVLYLYSGQKSWLFSIPLVVLCSVWAHRRNFYYEIFMIGCLGFFLLVLMACFSPIFNQFFYRIYSLVGRRLMIVSANNKFTYYDYFSKNPLMGLGGVFPRWLINIPNPYENIPYTFVISDLYYGLPEMNSNTGFMAEGYMRFGHIGTVLIFLILAWILTLMNRLQERCGYSLVVGAFVYPVLGLNDIHLIDTLLFGQWLPLLFILIFYVSYGGVKVCVNKRITT